MTSLSIPTAPLSFAQQRLWLLHRMDPGTTYNVPVALRWRALDVDALTAALGDVLARHESLRTAYPEVDGTPHQVVLPAEAPALAPEPVEDLDAALAETSSVVFDLTSAPPVLTRLFAVDGAHVLLVVLHHITADGASVARFVTDLTTAYTARAAGEDPCLPELPVQYADYTYWQQEVLGDPADPDSRVARQVTYWAGALAGAPEETGFPADRARGTDAAHTSGTVTVAVDTATHRALSGIAAGAGTTMFTVVRTALAALLTRYGAGTDLVFGTAAHGRADEALDELVGFFVNTVALRTDTSGDPTFAALLARVRDADLDAFANQDVPFERVVEQIAPTRSLARHPLFQIMLVHTATGDTAPVDGVEVLALGTGTVKFDMTVGVREGGDGLLISWDYATALFDHATVEDHATRLVRLLTSVAAAPDTRIGDLPLLTAAERAVRAPRTRETRCVHEIVAAHEPGATALVGDDGSLTYGDLDAWAGRIAAGLGDRRGEIVGVHLDRGPALIAALLGVLKAGGAYTLLDTGFPTERLRSVLARAKARAVVGTTPFPGVTLVDPDAVPDSPAPAVTVSPDDPAVVMFTSGSTGEPKGVLAPHRALTTTLTGQDYAGFGADDVWLQAAPVSWDAFATEVLGPLLHGGVCVLHPAGPPDPDAIARLATTHGVTVFKASASLFNHVLDEHPAVFATARWALTGGEPASAAHAARALREFPHLRLTNGYGPAESMGYSTTHAITAADTTARSIPIGTPVAGKGGYVLDARLRQVPPGGTGELYLTGGGLALGYLGAPGATAHRFVADPFRPGQRMYRTGDLVRPRRDGTLEYVGRVDQQVKVRGFRVEPAEVEATVAGHPAVARAAVLVREDRPGDHRIVAYVVPEPGCIDPAAIRRHVAERLPEHLVPSAVVVLTELPFTANGKLDRGALPAPGHTAGGAAPRTAQQEILCGLFAEVLGVAEVGVDDGFFDLGGHSLLALRLVSAARRALGVELAIRDLFACPTPATLATRVATAGRARPALLPYADRPDPLPLSPAQRRLWLLDQLNESSAAYHSPWVLRLRGALDGGALRAAIADVVARHETLRTVFPVVDGQPVTRILADATVPVDERAVTPEDLDDALTSAATRPFDLAGDLPLRVHLWTLGPGEHVLVLALHHIASDGWSKGPLLADLARAYTARLAGRADDTPPPAVQYADYTLWQRELEIEGQLDHWRDTLAGAPEQLDLPTDRPRPATPSGRGALASATFDAGPVTALAKSSGTTVFMVLHAALAALLTRLGAGTDLPIGAPVAGRTDAALDDLVGFFVNTLVLRTDTSGDPTFTDLLARVRDTDLAAYAHQDVPFEQVVEAVNPTRSLGRHPLFQVTLVVQNAGGGADVTWPGLTVSDVGAATGTAKFDLALAVTERPDDLVATLEYATDLFDASTAHTLLARLGTLLAAAAADPTTPIGRLDLLGEAERERLLSDAGPSTSPAFRTVADAVAGHAATTPHRGAVVTWRGRTPDTVDYAGLDAAANRVAAHLLARGVRPGDLVGVCLHRGLDAVAAPLGVLRAGAAYLPLDPDYPPDRLAYMLADADAALVLTEPSLRDRVTADGVPVVCVGDLPAAAPVSVAVTPDDAAYVIYTSGSTGRPKGVVVDHRGLADLCAWHLRVYGTAPGDRGGQIAAQGFDAAVWEMWPTLVAGAELHLPDRATLADADALVAWIVHAGLTTCFLPTPRLEVVLDDLSAAGGALRTVLTGGDALRRRPGPDTPFTLVNHYGPTECSVVATCGPVGTDTGVLPPIGRPVDNTRAFVLDRHLAPVPDGVTGELYLAADGLARGYLGRPGVTAHRFTACPYGPPGTRMYRTGDLVRRNAEGDLEFAGRADQQVKLRGFRIELGEIESVLTGHASVAHAAVVVREDRPGLPMLVAYVVSHGDLDASGLLADLGRTLPEHMVPTVVVPMATLPLTANGKLDRRALPAPELADTTGRAPRGPREEIVCGLFADLLGVADVGADDDFFRLGGHSLLATRLVSRLRTALGAELTVADLFTHPTPAGITGCLDRAAAPRPPVVAMTRPDVVPLSFAQRRLWFLNRMPGPSYAVPLALRLRGPLDVAALESAIGDVVARHEALRTTFPEVDGEPRQRVHPAVTVPLPVVDAGRALTAEPFDLTTEPPLRAALVRDAPEDHVLFLTLHHIACDGWSMGPLLGDLGTAYRARTGGHAPGWAPLPVQYPDYALWQRDLLGAESDRQLAYWRDTLAGLPDELALPADRPRQETSAYTGGRVPLWLDAGIRDAVTGLARRTGTTPFMVLQAGFAALLTRLGAGVDVPIGTPVAGRTDTALEDLVGFFVNTLVLRTDTSGDPTFTELLDRVRATDLAAFAHQDTPFERLVEVLNPARSLSRHPLCQVLMTLQNSGDGALDLPGLSVEPVPVDSGSVAFDLSLGLRETAEGIEGALAYRDDLFDERTARAVADRFVRLLTEVTAAPDTRLSTVEVLFDEERDLLDHGNATAHPVPATTLPELFAGQAARTPDAVALVEDDGTTHTYAATSGRIDRLARALRARGAGPERVVAVHLERSVDLVVALHAVQRAGAAYLPVDPGYPADRVALMIEDADPVLVLDEPALRALESAGAALPAPHPDDPAYLLYTSGSTGRPKGVAVTHRAIVNRLLWMQDTYPLGPDDRVLQKTPSSFDVSVWEFFWPLHTGAALVVARPDGHRDPAYLADLIDAQSVTTVHFVPSMLDAFVAHLEDTGRRCPSLRRVVCSGEALPSALARRFAAACDARLDNLYGPTEAAVDVTAHQATGRETTATVPIGRPVWNTTVHVLDAALTPVPPGVPGELYLGGVQLARGYHRRFALTAQRFVASPFRSGERLYRTGDVVRWLDDTGGPTLEYLSRADDQVKIRGVRIEPDEVAAALATHEDVATAAVIAREGRLIGYVVPARPVDPDAVRAHARERLPELLVPSAVVVLDALPLTPSGKLDRRALPTPEITRAARRAPATPAEAALCALFTEVLGRDAGPDDGFFDLGGHSLLATRLMAAIAGRFGTRLGVRTVFEAPTPAALARRLDGDTPAGDAFGVLLALRTTGDAPPLFCVHPAAGIGWVYSGLLPHLPGRPVYALQARGLSEPGTRPATMADLVKDYLEQIRTVRPDGPYHLLGWSFGANVAHALAAALREEGAEVGLVALLDGYPTAPSDRQWTAHAPVVLRALLTSLGYPADPAPDSPADVAARVLAEPGPLGGLSPERITALAEVFAAHWNVLERGTGATFDGDVLVVAATGDKTEHSPVPAGWRAHVTGHVHTHDLPYRHGDLATPGPLAEIGALVATHLEGTTA